ncbi:hypothetical protein RFI_32226 [Reticulomyxa filosa]|uniref:Uncharacterized protein n=1 Tax=Reticulomyxa filosa TaxID=46433 RepID=X6LWR2_RETFI|nr:hypothetical protein RFI_32226 [Reticulomyxa filosa]|eukprot:ETO05170.1 hypothetical protein RFI_32226 [Reticulomyxa filosa]
MWKHVQKQKEIVNNYFSKKTSTFCKMNSFYVLPKKFFLSHFWLNVYSILLFLFFLLSFARCDSELNDLIRQFRNDLQLLMNEQSYEEGIEYWRSLFSNDSIIEMNDRIFVGKQEVNFWVDSHLYNFRRIQMDTFSSDVTITRVGGEISINLGEDKSIDQWREVNYRGKISPAAVNEYKVLSTTLYATYVPRDPLGCVSVMKWLSLIWYGDFDQSEKYGQMYKIHKWLMISDKSLIEWEEELTCNWVAEPVLLKSSLKRLLDGMYKDADISTMVNTSPYIKYAKEAFFIHLPFTPFFWQYPQIVRQYYDTKAEMHIEREELRGHDGIVEWYQRWQKFGVTTMYNNIDEINTIGNTIVVKVLTIIVDSTGLCSNSYLWYGLYRFNGHGLIVSEQRFYATNTVKEAIQIISNCGDMSPQKTHSTTQKKKDL